MRAGRNGLFRSETHGSQEALNGSLFNSSFRQEVQVAVDDFLNATFDKFESKLDVLDAKLDLLLKSSSANVHIKEWYTPEEFGQVVGKTRYTVSEWCRLERINAEKAESGRGRNREWRISHNELKRYEREGLFPLKYPGM